MDFVDTNKPAFHFLADQPGIIDDFVDLGFHPAQYAKP
jgi:hypothetical protein